MTREAAALPTAATVYIFAEQYDAYLEGAPSSILVTTLISAITVPAVLPHPSCPRLTRASRATSTESAALDCRVGPRVKPKDANDVKRSL